MAAGIQVVNRDDKGKVKQDYKAERGKDGRVVEIDKLKEEESK